eukprot:gene1649-2980_t
MGLCFGLIFGLPNRPAPGSLGCTTWRGTDETGKFQSTLVLSLVAGAVGG